MHPLIRPKDRVILKKDDAYKVNDIVVFLRGKLLIAHRIVYASPDGKFFITKGDNNVRTDKKIGSSTILGKVVSLKRGGRTILLNHLYLTQSAFYLSELGTIAKLLKRARIRYIILRGVVPHIYFTGKPPQRHYADCDVLVRPDDFDETINVLKIAGYKKSPPTLFGIEFINATEVSLTKNRLPFPVVIDLHRGLGIPFTKVVQLNTLFPKMAAFEKDAFKYTTRVKMDRAVFPLLTNEFLFVYLILHWYKHNFEGSHRVELLRSLIDSGVVLPQVIRITRKYGLSPVVYLSFLIMKKYFGLGFPKELLTKLKVKGLKRLLINVAPPFLSPFSTGTRAYSGIKRVFLALILSPLSFAQKLRLLTSLKTLRFIPLTLFTLVSGILTRPGRSRFVIEDGASHDLNPNSKTKSISL
jgi:hypothetical protein